MELKEYIMVGGFLLTILSVFFSRKDKSDSKIENAIRELRVELKTDIDLLFKKLDNAVEDKLCNERRTNLKEDIDNLGNLVRRG